MCQAMERSLAMLRTRPFFPVSRPGMVFSFVMERRSLVAATARDKVSLVSGRARLLPSRDLEEQKEARQEPRPPIEGQRPRFTVTCSLSFPQRSTAETTAVSAGPKAG